MEIGLSQLLDLGNYDGYDDDDGFDVKKFLHKVKSFPTTVIKLRTVPTQTAVPQTDILYVHSTYLKSLLSNCCMYTFIDSKYG
jgi:hypothetical protein